ncbi:MAG: helix-turn-helix domain-containing protein [Methylomicrobium sp.]|nr:helix-turn-helix domain-containing protein [Methylomicrobium sp.]
MSTMLDTPNDDVKHEEHYLIDNVQMALHERINQLFSEHPEKTNAALSRFVGCSRATVTDWRNGKTKKIDGENAYKVAHFFNVNPEWVQTGKGQKNKLQPNTEPGPHIRGKVPLISWVRAGEWCEAIDNYAVGDAEAWLPCPVNFGPHAYALRIKGDSMTSPYPGTKSYPEGGIIFVDPEKAVTNGCKVIAKIENQNEVTFKEYREDSGKRYLKPLNPQYSMFEMTETTLLCGVVIGYFVEE